MTATSPTRHRRSARFPSMESLGFSDAPTETTVVYVAPSHLHHPSTTTRPTAPTGHLVQDLWDSTELDAPSLVDWKPISPDRRHLKARRFRWSRVLLVMVVAVARWICFLALSAVDRGRRGVGGCGRDQATALSTVSTASTHSATSWRPRRAR